MLEQFIDYARNRVSIVAGATTKDPDTQSTCAQAAVEIDEMRCLIHSTFDRLMEWADHGEPLPMELRLLCKYHAVRVPDRCPRLAMAIFQCVGGSEILEDKPFARIYNDSIGARQHAAAQHQMTARNWGSSMLGGECAEWYL